jgi:hypothetical protein
MAIQIRTARNLRLNADLYKTHVALYCQVMRKTMADVVKNEARLLARDACDFTPPFSGSAPAVTSGGEGGFGSKARDKGRAAVSRDVRKIFAPLVQAPASLVASRGDLGIFTQWIIKKDKLPPPHEPSWIFDIFHSSGNMTTQIMFERFKQRHAGQNNMSGFAVVTDNDTEQSIESIHRRIRGNPHYRINKNRKPTNFIADFDLVEAYIKKVQARVGKLKAGWYHAGLKLGFMPTSQWIAGQGSSNAILQTKLIGATPTVKIGNAIAKDHSQGWHLFQKAWNHRGFAMREKMLHALKGKNNHGTLLQICQKLPKGFNLTNTSP